MKPYRDEDQRSICLYCEHAKILPSGDQVLCPYKGIFGIGNTCHRFRYDILKRVPTPPRHVLRPDDADLAWEDANEQTDL